MILRSSAPSSATSQDAKKQKAEEEYIYTPTEKHIFDPSPYKSHLLPLWRFRNPSLARKSANDIWEAFLEYERQNDFIGMDNARKFLQMGMTRAKRYATWKGGKKYAKASTPTAGSKKRKREQEDCTSQAGSGIDEKEDEDSKWQAQSKEKEEASMIFREAWERAKGWEGYVTRKEAFLKTQRERMKKKVS